MLGAGLGAIALLVVHFALLHTYWNGEEGVYALTSRMLLHGADLYRGVVAAQPPSVFMVGTALLRIHDSLEWLRFGVALLQLGAGVVAAQIVWRITRSRIATVITPAAILLGPWAVHEHGSLTPEVVALPVFLGALSTSASEDSAPLCGVLCGLLPAVKLPYLLPAAVLVAASARPARAARFALGTVVIGFGAATVAWGPDLWQDTVVAQAQTGYRAVLGLRGWWLQAAWNLLGLLMCAAAAAAYRAQTHDRRLLRSSLALSASLVPITFTTLKNGTGLNVLVPVEAVLVPGAITGVVFAVRSAASASTLRGARAMGLATCAAGVFTLAQGVSLLASPKDPQPFERLGAARVGWAEVMSSSEFDRALAVAKACPPGASYPGLPLIAYAAKRAAPAGQPDGFLIAYAGVLRRTRERVEAVKDLCG